mgnify:CR=1 FL=1
MSKILIVEDEESIADLERDYLELSGFEVEIENAGDVGLQRALKEEFDLPAIDIHLHKAIPMGAGLGGGSSDAAFMLKMLNNHFNLALSAQELEQRATKLGADCAFFIENN